jgi:soluble lytic murein transglycosylase
MSVVVADATGADMYDLFKERQWKTMDEYFSKADSDISSRDLYLYANSLWLRGEWQRALSLMEASSELPPSLMPYRTMMMILGFERTGQRQKALEFAEDFFDNSPDELRYYVAYAIARLGGDPAIWYSKMLEYADNRDQKKTALRGLVDLEKPEMEVALELLKIDPYNSKALAILLSPEADPLDGEMNFFKGYSYFLAGKYKEAVPLLERVSEDFPDVLQRARYFLAFSMYRLKMYEDALRVWKGVALEQKNYASLSVRRIANLAGRLAREKVRETLREIAHTASGSVRLTSIYYLGELAAGDEAGKYEDMVLRDYPQSEYALRFLWERGWNSWKNKEFNKALEFWEKALTPGIDDDWNARFLYWKGRAEEQLGITGYTDTLDKLASEHPFSIYTFKAFPNGTRKLSEKLPPELESEPSLLEQWGFISYALMQLQKESSPESIFRRAMLSSWMGDDRSAFTSAARIIDALRSYESIPRKLLELLYPRPYFKTVIDAAEKSFVEPALVWAIMRQESAFDPRATSSVGASGLMQLMPATAKDEASRLELEDYDIYQVDTNIRLGVSHIAWLLRRIRRLDWSIAAYNAGSGNLAKWVADQQDVPFEEWVEEIPYPETYDYLKKVLSNLYVYRWLYERKVP